MHFQAAVVQLDAWRALAEPEIGSNSVLSILPPDCQSLETPSCEDRVHPPGQGETSLLNLLMSARLQSLALISESLINNS